MKKRIKIILSSAMLLICILLFCPLTSKLNLSLHTLAASNENLYVTSKNRLFTKTVVKGDVFKITIIEKKKVKAKNLSFKCNNNSVATIDSTGTIRAINNGKAKIKVYTKKGHHKVCTFTIDVVDSIPRTLFIGDSRTVYMFNQKNVELCGVVKDGMYVYARAGAQFWYIDEVMGKVDPNTYDTVVTWMGANDRGSFTKYKYCYNETISSGKKLILCTVGPVQDYYLDEIGQVVFNNGLMLKFNRDLKKWAKKNNVSTINLYSYILNKGLRMDPKDGIHYLPRPTTKIWKRILKQYKKLS